MYTRDTELRRLQSNDVNRLAEALGFDGGRKLMETIPKYWTIQNTLNGGVATAKVNHKLNGDINCSSTGELKYRPEQIRLIEEATRQTSGCYFAEILIQEWSTSGRKHERPTVGLLLQLLIKADLWNAADFVAEHFLNEPVPDRPLEGPGAKVDISIPTDCLRSVVDYVNDSNGFPDSDMLNVHANYENSTADPNRDYFIKFSHFDKDIRSGTAPPKPPPRTQRAARQQNTLNQQQQQQPKENASNHQPTTQTINDVGSVVESNAHYRSKRENRGSLQTSKQQQQQLQHNTLTTHNIPELSDLLQVANSGQQSTIKSEEEVANGTPLLSLLEGKSSNTMSGEAYHNSLEVIASSTSNVLPEQSTLSRSNCDSLPLITELNLDNTGAEVIKNVAGRCSNSIQQQEERTSSNSPNPSSDGSRCSSLSNDSFDDDDNENVYGGVNTSKDRNADDTNDLDEYCREYSLPNLSVFGRQSPYNDSSLTTVTCTSGDNSFELSFNDSSSTSTTDPTAQRK